LFFAILFPIKRRLHADALKASQDFVQQKSARALDARIDVPAVVSARRLSK
jgi:hypothetical protein